VNDAKVIPPITDIGVYYYYEHQEQQQLAIEYKEEALRHIFQISIQRPTKI
jgi:hypothetical protein